MQTCVRVPSGVMGRARSLFYADGGLPSSRSLILAHTRWARSRKCVPSVGVDKHSISSVMSTLSRRLGR